MLYGTSQGASTILHVVSLGGYALYCLVREMQRVSHLGYAAKQGLELYVRDAAYVLLAQLVKVYHIVQTIQELRCKLFLQSLLHYAASLFLALCVAYGVLETNTRTIVLDLTRATIAGHDDYCVAEVDRGAIAIRQTALVHRMRTVSPLLGGEAA